MAERTLLPKRSLVRSLYVDCLRCKRNEQRTNYCSYRIRGLCKGKNFFIQKKTRPYVRTTAKQQHTMRRNWLKFHLAGAYAYFKQAHKELTLEEQEQFLTIAIKIAQLKVTWRKNNENIL